MGTAHSVIFAALLCWWPVFALAHPFHGTYSELQWGESGAVLEVAMRVKAEDLEQALAYQTGATIAPLESTPLAVIQRWLAENFLLQSSDGATHDITVAGKEVGYEASWLYFTVTAHRDQTLSLTVPALLQLHPKQQNRVQLLWQDQQINYVFTAAEQARQIWPLPAEHE